VCFSMYILVYMCVCMCSCVCSDARTQRTLSLTHSHSHSLALTRTHSHSRSLTHSLTHSHSRTLSLTHSHSLTRTHSHSHTHSHSRTHSLIIVCSCGVCSRTGACTTSVNTARRYTPSNGRLRDRAPQTPTVPWCLRGVYVYVCVLCMMHVCVLYVMHMYTRVCARVCVCVMFLCVQGHRKHSPACTSVHLRLSRALCHS